MDELAQVCERIAAHASRLKKVALLAGYLRTLPDEDLVRAVRFLSSGPLAATEDQRLAVGHAVLRDAVLPLAGWDLETLRTCYQSVGDTGETIGLLLVGRTEDQPLSLALAESLYLELNATRRTAQRVAILRTAFARYRPLTIKYFIKAITGNFRIGLQEKMVEEAVAAACDVAVTHVREANNRLGDLSRVALAARLGTLHEIEARLFHPMDFMLAKPLEFLHDLGDPREWWIEDKFDGIRSQVHFQEGMVKIYTRGMDEVTASYPEVCAAFQQLPGSGVLDGELLAWRDERPLAFTMLQQRLARKRVTAELLAEIPVVFMGYDALYRNGVLLLEAPIEERRAALEEVLDGHGKPLLVSHRRTADTHQAVDHLFDRARDSGNEGLLLKRRGSIYESGRRSGAWRKLKRAYATLDVVVTAAEQGHGRRATMLSDYTFAVRHDGRFVNVGKAYSGLTDPEIRELTRVFREAATDRFGRTLLVRPEIVLEVAFDGVQKSPRHKSGFALRFPRIVRWRRDKTPEQIDDLARVKELYEASLAVPGAAPGPDTVV